MGGGRSDRGSDKLLYTSTEGRRVAANVETMYQHDTNTEGISQSLPDPQAPPENLRSIETESIEVKVEPILTRVNSIEGGARRIATQEKLKQKVRRIRHYLKIHKDEQWHGFKIALAVLLSSTPVLVGPLYDYFGMNSLWLIISVSIFAAFLILLSRHSVYVHVFYFFSQKISRGHPCSFYCGFDLQ